MAATRSVPQSHRRRWFIPRVHRKATFDTRMSSSFLQRDRHPQRLNTTAVKGAERKNNCLKISSVCVHRMLRCRNRCYGVTTEQTTIPCVYSCICRMYQPGCQRNAGRGWERSLAELTVLSGILNHQSQIMSQPSTLLSAGPHRHTGRQTRGKQA